ncbi:hypothetical protein BO71DRAFT_137973 [Aspergillus ellipticus CBS 707.79]|uniref:Uncharacterized protein n=1 Tax=Aspergillus ellipticus CBS 707.79 TaxID=1448320 RepID=A0A319DQ99_9EURO|nr:hypothetical protein BO71DRAFT_137973 [Aspergillus ellipticus CBS 707.79]
MKSCLLVLHSCTPPAPPLPTLTTYLTPHADACYDAMHTHAWQGIHVGLSIPSRHLFSFPLMLCFPVYRVPRRYTI